MDVPDSTARSHRDEFADLIADGLILWRLSSSGQSDLWCLVFEHPNGLCFALDDDSQGTQPCKVCGEHSDIVSLLNRTESLKAALLRSGWTEVDVD
jgi:hypothetical protein